MFKSTKSACAAFLLVFSAATLADEGQGKQGPRPGHKPPQVAIDACSGKNDGDACNFTGRNNDNIEGSCRRGPRQEHELACVPKNHRPGQRNHNGSEEFRDDQGGGNMGEGGR